MTKYFAVTLLCFSSVGSLFAQEWTTSGDVNHPDPLRTSITAGSPIGTPAEMVSKFTGTIATAIPLLPGISLSYSSGNVPATMNYENRDVQSSWVGAGWSFQQSSIIANLNGTRDTRDDEWYYIDESGSGTVMVNDNNGGMRLENNPFWKIELATEPVSVQIAEKERLDPYETQSNSGWATIPSGQQIHQVVDDGFDANIADYAVEGITPGDFRVHMRAPIIGSVDPNGKCVVTVDARMTINPCVPNTIEIWLENGSSYQQIGYQSTPLTCSYIWCNVGCSSTPSFQSISFVVNNSLITNYNQLFVRIRGTEGVQVARVKCDVDRLTIATVDHVKGITITHEDGSKYKYGDFVLGYGEKNANRCVFYWGNRVTDMLTQSGAGLIAYRWDLSQVVDAYGVESSNLYYWQEQESVTIGTGSLNYTRASYIDKILNPITNQKIEFLRGERNSDEYQDIENNSARIEQYEKKYLSEIKVFPTSTSATPITKIVLDYDIIAAAGAAKTKRLLKSITQHGHNTGAFPSLNLYYDQTKDYILSSVKSPTGGTTQIVSQLHQSGYAPLFLGTDYQVLSGVTQTEGAYIIRSSAQTIGQYDQSTGTLKVLKWIGEWKATTISISNALLGTTGNNVNISVSDNHVAIYYKKSDNKDAFRIYDWQDDAQTWSLGLERVSSNINAQYSYMLGGLSQSGTHAAIYVAGQFMDAGPQVRSWIWDSFNKQWAHEVIYTFPIIVWPDTYFATDFQVSDDMIAFNRWESVVLQRLGTSGGTQLRKIELPSLTYGWQLFLRKGYIGYIFGNSGSTRGFGVMNINHDTYTGLATLSQQAFTNFIVQDYHSRPSYYIFAEDRVLLCEYGGSNTLTGQTASVRVWTKIENEFSAAQTLTYFSGSSWTGWFGNEYYWNLNCQVSNDWAFVFQHTTSRVNNNPFEGKVFAFKWNKATSSYEATSELVFPFDDPVENTYKIFASSTAYLTENFYVINTLGRNATEGSHGPRVGYTDVYSLDRTNPAGWTTAKTRIFSSNSQSGKLRDLFAGLNFVGNHSNTTGQTKVRFFHGIDRNWSTTVKTYRVSQTVASPGIGNDVTIDYSYSSNRTFDPFLTAPNFAYSNVSNGTNGFTRTYFSNSISQPRLRGIPTKSEVYKQSDNVNPISTTLSNWNVYTLGQRLYHVRLESTESTNEGITTGKDFVYNDNNGQPSKITEDINVTINTGANKDKETEITYAFESHQTGMNASGAHMLIQPYETKTYEKNSDGSRTLIADSKVIYSSASPYYPMSTQIWDGSSWLTTSTIISRNSFGLVTQVDNGIQGVNKIRSTTKYGYNGVMPIATVTNATDAETKVIVCDKYNSTSYGSLAEGLNIYNYGNVSGAVVYSQAARGFKDLSQKLVVTSIDNQGAGINISFPSSSLVSSKDYLIEFDILMESGDLQIITRTGNTHVSQAIFNASNYSKKWHHAKIRWNLNNNNTNANIWFEGMWNGSKSLPVTCYLDNFRIYPIDALCTSQAYDPATLQVISTTDENGVTRYVGSDGFGRSTMVVK